MSLAQEIILGFIVWDLTGVFVMSWWWRDDIIDVTLSQVLVFILIGWLVWPFFLVIMIAKKTVRILKLDRIVLWKARTPL